ncbi:Cutinase transcription factor 1 beta [Colletotrichum siamense]|uniref:Cutinase transcription factor 1 beta n=1 Tax=Colletotrichum siamense TaxID=690259 RepID=UPI0018725FA1|nr:Cutinase transcription factor 1 beta [Colletotrichum siamense]KAF5491524.1 Cutinase transcription factor 1 beta [Colletotrichum siamense]
MWNAWSLGAVEVGRKIFVGAHRPAADVPTSQFSGHGGSSTDISMMDETATQIFRDAVDPDSVAVGASSQPVENAPRASSSNTSTSFSTSRPFPGFIESLRLCRDGYVEFLEKQGAFRLPSLSLQSALLKAFIEFVYPRMPLLNLTKLCEAIEFYDGGTKDFSLLLYQAILFAGSAHVKQADLAGTEFSDKLSLRKTLYQRAELLFELGGPQDHLALVQVALLLTFRGISQDSQLDRKDSWQWMNTAVTLALDIGLNKEPSLKAFDNPEIKLRRRLWWCCYVRDKILALGMSKPSRIKDEDHSTSMLSIHDMDLETLKTERTIFGRIQLGPYDHVEMVESAELCVEKTRLSMLMHRTLQLQQSAGNSYQFLVRSSLCLSGYGSPAFRHPFDRGGIFCTWLTILLDIHYTMNATRTEKKLIPTDRLSLWRHQSASCPNVQTTSLGLQPIFTKGKMDPYLPIGAITILCPAISTHLINMKNRNQGSRHAAVSGFRVCMRVLDKLRDLYPATEVTLAYLDVVLQKAQMESAISVRAVFQLNERDRSDMRMILGRHSGQSWDTSVTSKATDLGFAGLEDAMNQFEQFDTPEFSADYGAEASMGSTYHGTLLDPLLSPKDALGQVYFNDLNPWQCLDLGWIEDANAQLPIDDALIPATTNLEASWFQDNTQ